VLGGEGAEPMGSALKGIRARKKIRAPNKKDKTKSTIATKHDRGIQTPTSDSKSTFGPCYIVMALKFVDNVECVIHVHILSKRFTQTSSSNTSR